MSVARGRTGWQIASAVLLNLVVLWCLAPTYPVHYMGDPNTSAEGPVHSFSWLDPRVPFGGAAFHAPLTTFCAVVAAVGAWYGFAQRRTSRVPAWWALAGAVILAGWSLVLGSWDWPQSVALTGLLAGAGAVLWAARRAVPTLVSGSAAR